MSNILRRIDNFCTTWNLTTEEKDDLIETVRDIVADYDRQLLAQFDPAATEHTDLYTYITCKLAEIARLTKRTTNV